MTETPAFSGASTEATVQRGQGQPCLPFLLGRSAPCETQVEVGNQHTGTLQC